MRSKLFFLLCVINVIRATDKSGLYGDRPAWVQASYGQVPYGALVGGIDDDGETLYVARARHGGELIPGHLKPSHQVTYVSYDWSSWSKTDYEVLVDCIPVWIFTSGYNAPWNAFEAGCAYDGPYHVCRLWDRINGKAHLSHGRCFAPYQGGEASETYFEILVCLNEYWRNETTINDDQQAH